MDQYPVKISTEYDGKKRRLFGKPCAVCSNRFWIPRNRLSSRNTCSTLCLGKSRRPEYLTTGVKDCPKCKKTKNLDDFNKKGNIVNSYCRHCSNTAWHEYYSVFENRVSHCIRNQKRKRILVVEGQELVRSLKQNPCVDCEKKYPYWVMQFDHLPGREKITNISALVGEGCTKERLLSEISKCELVCANCHSNRTFHRMGLSSNGKTQVPQT